MQEILKEQNPKDKLFYNPNNLSN